VNLAEVAFVSLFAVELIVKLGVSGFPARDGLSLNVADLGVLHYYESNLKVGLCFKTYLLIFVKSLYSAVFGLLDPV
jgi:hypothetical protein